MAAVMAMCGADGIRAPRWVISRPASKRGAASIRPDIELRGRRGVEGHRAARDPAAAMHDERHRAPPAVVDVDARLPQPGQQLADRALRGARVAAELNIRCRQARHGRHEPQHGAGVADVDPRLADDCRPGVTVPGRLPGRGRCRPGR